MKIAEGNYVDEISHKIEMGRIVELLAYNMNPVCYRFLLPSMPKKDSVLKGHFKLNCAERTLITEPRHFALTDSQ